MVRFNGAALFQSGEQLLRNLAQFRQQWLQWGRSFSERRTTLLSAIPAAYVNPLQWGRSFSERRTRIDDPVNIGLPLLQWGRSFSERRTAN